MNLRYALNSNEHSSLPPRPDPGEPRFDGDGDPGPLLIVYLVACAVIVAMGWCGWEILK